MTADETPQAGNDRLQLGPVFHINLNCRDLGRCEPFYRERLGLRPLLHTVSDRQDVAAFGWSASHCAGWMFGDSRGWQSPLLDLIEWKHPPLNEGSRWSRTAPGLNRLIVTVPQGTTGSAVEHRPCPGDHHTSVCYDPEGIGIEVSSNRASRLVGVVINCRDLQRARPFYQELLGLRLLSGAAAPDTRKATEEGRPGGEDLRGFELADARPEDPFIFRLVDSPGQPSERSASPTANDRGLCRIAFETYQIDRDYRSLRAVGVDFLAPPEWLSMGPGRRPLRCCFFRDPEGNLLELIELGER